MPVTVDWDRTLPDTLYTRMEKPTTLAEHHAAVLRTAELMQTRDQDVGVIVDMREAGWTARDINIMAELRKTSAKLPPNAGLHLIVGAPFVLESLMGGFMRALRLGQDKIQFARTLEEAQRKMQAHLERKQHGL